jgi:hypothetical protein
MPVSRKWIRLLIREATSCMNPLAVSAPRSPSVYEMISFVSASRAVHVHTLPAPA